MNLLAVNTSKSRLFSRRFARAYTLAEMMIAMSVFSLVIAAVLACHFAGLEFNEFVRPKVQNAQYARQTLSRIIEHVRCAISIQVGTGTKTSFTPVGSNRPQVGNALRIYPTTNATPYIYYYQDSFTSTVQMIPVGSSNDQTIATCVTNTNIFSMENFSGTVLTNNQSGAVLSMVLQMLRASDKSGMSDAYQVRAKVTRRNIF